MVNKALSENSETELKRHRSILNSFSVSFFMCKLNGDIIDTNDFICHDLGYSCDELHNINVNNLIIGEKLDFEIIKEALEKKNSSYSINRNFISKNNRTFPVEIELSSIVVDEESYISALVRDSSKRENIEHKLNLTQFAIDQAADAAFWTELTSKKFVYVNNKACEILGYTKDELVTMGVSDIDKEFTEDDWPQLINDLKHGYTNTFESTLTNKSQETFPVEITANHLIYEGTGYIVTFIREITTRRKDEAILRDAKEKAEKANQAKSDFLTSMSHELKTPLNAIIGYSEILLYETEPEPTDEQLHCTKSINQAGHHLLGLIDDVLDLATIESGKINLQYENVSLCEVVKNSINILKLAIKKKNLSFDVFNKSSKNVTVWADEGKLTQIVLNLISNAIKYNRTDGSVEILYIQHDSYVQLFIKDTGYGIPDNKVDQLFSSFRRLGKENSDIEGTGVGLVICKSLINLMDGEIGFDSELNVGSCFHITIPTKHNAHLEE